MTEAEILMLSKYANGVWRKDCKIRGYYEGDSFNDFKQDLFYFVLKYPDDNLSLIISRVKYSKKKCKEALENSITEMIPFSQLVFDDGDEKYIGAFAIEDDHGENTCIFDIAEFLYPTDERLYREDFIDYMYGQCIDPQRSRNIRKKVFRNRFSIIEFLYNCGKLDKKQKLYYYSLAEIMETHIRCSKRKSIDVCTRISARKYYEKNKEKFAERAKRNYERRKAEKAKNEKVSESKEDIK